MTLAQHHPLPPHAGVVARPMMILWMDLKLVDFEWV